MTNEAEALREAAVALESAFQAVFAAAREGMTAEEVDAIQVRELRARGAELLPARNSPFIVAPDGVPPKRRLNRQPLKRGALWAMDTSIRRHGACADLGRYGYIGELPVDLAQRHRNVLARQE